MPILTNKQFNALPDAHLTESIDPSHVFSPEEFNALPDPEFSQPSMFSRIKDKAVYATTHGGMTLGGAIIGGIAGGPPGSAIGASLGRSAELATEETDRVKSPMEIGADVAATGALQRAGEAVAPYVSKGIGAVANKAGAVSDWLTSKIGKSFIKAAKVDVAYGKEPAKAIVDEGIIASSWDDLLNKIGAAKAKLGDMYHDIFASKSIPEKIDIGSLAGPIDSAIKEASKFPTENATLLERLRGLKLDIEKYNGVTTPEKAQALKSSLYKITKFTANKSDDEVTNKIKQQIAGQIAKKLESEIPALGPLNERYANLAGLEHAAINRSIVMERGDIIGAPEIVGGISALGGGVPLGVGVAAGMRALKTPIGATSAMAALQSKIPGAIVKGTQAAIESPAAAAIATSGMGEKTGIRFRKQKKTEATDDTQSDQIAATIDYMSLSRQLEPYADIPDERIAALAESGDINAMQILSARNRISELQQKYPGIENTESVANLAGTVAMVAPAAIKAIPTAAKSMGRMLKSEKGAVDFIPEQESNYRVNIPKIRGEWTQEKIKKVLKGPVGSSEFTNRSFTREIKKFNNPQELSQNLYFHGTGGFISKGLKPSISMKLNENFGGGYGEQYYGISLSKNKNIASNFTGSSKSGTVYPVILKKDAKVKEMPEIQDAADIEDVVAQLWNEKVDAVKIGDWTSPHSEQELVVLNPRAIVLGKGQYFTVFNKQKFENPSENEMLTLFNNAKQEAE